MMTQMQDTQLLELATRFDLGDDHYLERDGGGWVIRHEVRGTINPSILNADGEAWRYKYGTRFPTRRAALDCLEARGSWGS